MTRDKSFDNISNYEFYDPNALGPQTYQDYSTDSSDPDMPPGLKARIEARDQRRAQLLEEGRRYQEERTRKTNTLKSAMSELVMDFLNKPEQLQDGATQDKITIAVVPELFNKYQISLSPDNVDEDAKFLNLALEDVLIHLQKTRQIGSIRETLGGYNAAYYFARKTK